MHANKVIVSGSIEICFQKGKTMNKKKTKLFSWTVASVAALTLLCGTWASAAVSVTSGADGIYLRNSGKDYTIQVDAPKNHFCGIRVDEVRLTGKSAPVQVEIEIGGTAPVVTPAPETQAPAATQKPSTSEAPVATSDAPVPNSPAPVATSDTPQTSDAPVPNSPAPVPNSPAPVATSDTPSEEPVSNSVNPAASQEAISAFGYSASAISETPVQALVNLAAPAEANAETYYATIGIPASYLDTLSDGSHTVVMDFVEGSVSTTITVTSDASILTNGNPSTGDTTHVLPYVLLAAGSACVLVFLAKKEKKETR